MDNELCDNTECHYWKEERLVTDCPECDNNPPTYTKWDYFDDKYERENNK